MKNCLRKILCFTGVFTWIIILWLGGIVTTEVVNSKLSEYKLKKERAEFAKSQL